MTQLKKKRLKENKTGKQSILPIALQTTPSKNGNILNVFLSFAVSIILLIFVLRGFNLKDTISYLENLNPSMIILATLAYYLSYLVRAFRWQIMVYKAGSKIPYSLSISSIFTSFAINCVLPAKAGDVYRAYNSEKTAKLGFFTLLGTIVAERVIDMTAVMCAFAITFFLVIYSSGINEVLKTKLETSALAIFLVSAAVIVVIVAVVVYLDFIIKLLIPAKYKTSVVEIKMGFRKSISTFLPIFVLTLFIWILEFGSYILVVTSATTLLQVSQSAFTAVASTLSNAVPFTPGGLGAFELASRELLVFFKMNSDEALAIILLLRLINYWGLIAIGSIFALLPLFKKK